MAREKVNFFFELGSSRQNARNLSTVASISVEQGHIAGVGAGSQLPGSLPIV
jgi:hypothetical protein